MWFSWLRLMDGDLGGAGGRCSICGDFIPEEETLSRMFLCLFDWWKVGLPLYSLWSTKGTK